MDRTRRRRRWGAAEGQAAVELVALLPLLALLGAAAWQLVLTGYAAWSAGSAARAAARAAAVGDDPRAAARAALPGRLERELRVRAGDDGTVRVVVRVPPALGLRLIGTVAASAHFREQEAQRPDRTAIRALG